MPTTTESPAPPPGSSISALRRAGLAIPLTTDHLAHIHDEVNPRQGTENHEPGPEQGRHDCEVPMRGANEANPLQEVGNMVIIALVVAGILAALLFLRSVAEISGQHSDAERQLRGGEG